MGARAKVYVAGPMSNGDTGQHIRNAIELASWIYERGAIPYIPHLTHFWHMIRSHTYEEWLDMDMEWLEICDALICLPGLSPGTDREIARARDLGIPVFTDREALAQWLGA